MNEFIIHKDEFHFIENLQIPFGMVENPSLKETICEYCNENNIDENDIDDIVVRGLKLSIYNLQGEYIVYYGLFQKQEEELEKIKTNILYHRRNKIIEDIL